ncbi:polysaccharide deacetylase family protein [Enterobacter bugandensis]|uniref:polysaccharide deacetylase family protein n=1 Tax=Enterobacter bugandensis TaxID=881260 RepID=UPI00359C97F5
MRKVHLTFDDGSHHHNTPHILDTLGKYKIKATFFVLGERVKTNGHLLKRIAANGHRVGNHTFSHKQLTTLADLDVINEITSTERAISQYMKPDFILRPPYGSRDSRVNKIVE